MEVKVWSVTIWGNFLLEVHNVANQFCQGGVPPSYFIGCCRGDTGRQVLSSSPSVFLLKWLLMFFLGCVPL